MKTRHALQSARTSGFNLIEAAIVLAVVGLVIGGIWVAAAHVLYQFKISRTLEQISLIVNCARQKVSPNDTLTHAEYFLLDAGCLPGDAEAYNHGSGYAIHTAIWDLVHISLSGSGTMIVDFMNPGVSPDPKFTTMCKNMVPAMSGKFGRDPQNLTQIRYDNGTTYTASQFPLTLGNFTCPTYDIYMDFNIPFKP